MRTPINTEYKTLTVYFIMHASISLQFKAYRPKLVIKFLVTAILPFPKCIAEEHTEQSTTWHPNRRQTISQATSLKSYF